MHHLFKVPAVENSFFQPEVNPCLDTGVSGARGARTEPAERGALIENGGLVR
jgi:hypothetical protein